MLTLSGKKWQIPWSLVPSNLHWRKTCVQAKKCFPYPYTLLWQLYPKKHHSVFIYPYRLNQLFQDKVLQSSSLEVNARAGIFNKLNSAQIKLKSTKENGDGKDPFAFEIRKEKTPPPPPPPLPPPPPSEKELAKLSLWDKYKKMFKDYWYVLVPVHVVTSVVWFGIFYYMAASGVDIVSLLKAIGASEGIINRMESSGAGYFAIAYALYKIATPVRYTVTLGGTTVSIRYLARWGLISPLPSPAKFHQYVRVKGILFMRRRRLRSQGKALEQMKIRKDFEERVKKD